MVVLSNGERPLAFNVIHGGAHCIIRSREGTQRICIKAGSRSHASCLSSTVAEMNGNGVIWMAGNNLYRRRDFTTVQRNFCLTLINVFSLPGGKRTHDRSVVPSQLGNWFRQFL